MEREKLDPLQMHTLRNEFPLDRRASESASTPFAESMPNDFAVRGRRYLPLARARLSQSNAVSGITKMYCVIPTLTS
jgi:hypothetical protein